MRVWFCLKNFKQKVRKIKGENFGEFKIWDSLHKKMMKLCLMASHGYPHGPGLVLPQEQGVSRMIKECPSYFPTKIMKQDMVQPGGPFDLKCNGIEEHSKPITLLCEPKLIVDVDPKAQWPVIIDKPVPHLDTTLFSFGIAEKCTRHEKILKFLKSGSEDMDKGELDLSLLSDLIQPVMFGVHQHPYSSLIYPSGEFDAQNPLPDFVGEMIHNSKLTVNSDGQVVFASSGTEIKDILSVVSEFQLSSNSTSWRKQEVVPYFNWTRRNKVHASVVSVAPPKSPEKIKPSLKKKTSKNLSRDRNLYKANYFHACESLLSLMLNKRLHGKTAILSLKKSGPELPELLTQFSAGIAGTGLAVLFSVVCKVAYARAPISTSKLFTTGLGFGLVWLSWAVNKLRDTVVHISKNASKLNTSEKEMSKRVEKSVNDVYFRAATLMAIAMLRFA